MQSWGTFIATSFDAEMRAHLSAGFEYPVWVQVKEEREEGEHRSSRRKEGERREDGERRRDDDKGRHRERDDRCTLLNMTHFFIPKFSVSSQG